MLFIASATGYDAVHNTTTLDTSSTLNILVDDVLVAYIGGFAPSDQTLSSIAETGASNDFTLLAKTTLPALTVQGGYVLATTANATATFRATYGTTTNLNSPKELIILQFRPEAGETISFGSGPAANSNSYGNNPSSGNLSTASVNSMFIGCVYNDRAAISAELLAGASVDGVIRGTNSYMSTSYSQFSSAQTTQNYSTTSANGVWAAELMILDIAVAASAAITSVGGDDVVLDAEQNVSFVTSGFSGEISTVQLVSGTSITTINPASINSTGGSGDFDLIDISTLTSPTVGAPLTTANNVVVARLTDA